VLVVLSFSTKGYSLINMNKQFVSSGLVQVIKKNERESERYLLVIDVVYCCTLDANLIIFFSSSSSFLILHEEKKDFFSHVLIWLVGW
jgi:hypothetical protein